MHGNDWFLLAMVAWIVYMLTFRHKQYMELNDHMKGNLRDAGKVAGKTAGVGFKLFRMFMK
jgi:hypothetical protein